MKYNVFCGTLYAEGDPNWKFCATFDTLEEAMDKIDNHLVGYPVQVIEVRRGDYVYTIDMNTPCFRPLCT